MKTTGVLHNSVIQIAMREFMALLNESFTVL